MRPIGRSFRLALAIVVALTTATARADVSAPKPGELIDRYAAFLGRQGRLRFDSIRRIYEKGGPYGDWTWTSTVGATFVRSGARWRLHTRNAGFRYIEGRYLPYFVEGENVFDGISELNVSRDDRDARDLPSLDEETAERLVARGSSGRVETQVVAEPDAAGPLSAGGYAVQNDTVAIYGVLPGDWLSVVEVFRQPTTRLSARNESIEGRATQVVEGKTRYGTITLWLDPAAEYSPARLRQTKSENDFMGKSRIRDMKPDLGVKREKPSLPLRGVECQFDYRVTPEGGIPTITGYTRVDRFLYPNDVDYWTRDEVTLRAVNHDPRPAELEPTLPIPEGTAVVVRDAPGVVATWIGGKLVLGYDTQTVAPLKAKWSSERPAPFAGYRVPVLVGALALALAAGLRWYRARVSG